MSIGADVQGGWSEGIYGNGNDGWLSCLSRNGAARCPGCATVNGSEKALAGAGKHRRRGFLANGKTGHIAEIRSVAQSAGRGGELAVYRRPGGAAVFGTEQATCCGSVQCGRMDGINGKNRDAAIIHRKLCPSIRICRLNSRNAYQNTRETQGK